MCGVNRRKNLQVLFRLGLCSLSPFPVLLNAGTGKENAYFPNYVDVASLAGLTAKTVVAGHESKDFLVSTTGGGIALFDYDNDGWLDIFVVNSWGFSGFPKDKEPINHLYKNNRDGTFTDVTAKANLVRSGWGQGVCVGDYNNDGFMDLFVTYYGKNVLYRNNGDGTFTDVTRESGLLQVEDHWNSGAAFLDYDRDGYLDLFVSNYVAYEAGLALYDSDPSLVGVQSPVLYGPKGLEGSKNILYHNNGNGFFTDRTFQAGLSGQTSAVKWGTAFVDFDNDGQLDLLMVTGAIYPPRLSAGRTKPNEDEGKKILYRNLGNGRFQDISDRGGPGLLLPRCSRGAAFGDIFHTGQIDVAINNLNDVPTLLRNQSASPNSWMLVRLVGTRTYRAAIGSRVIVEAEGRRQIQEVRSGGSFCSQSDLRLHFGLGRAREATRVQVKWLGGGQ